MARMSISKLAVVAAVVVASLAPISRAGATPVFSDGFESGDLSAWTTTGGFETRTTPVHTGSYSGVNTTNDGWVSKEFSTQYTELYARVWLNVLSQQDTFRMLKFQTSAGANIMGLFIKDGGQLRARNYATATNTTSATAIHPGWNDLQVRAKVSGTSSVVQVWLDGQEVTDLSSTATLGTTAISGIELGNRLAARVHQAAYDDIQTDTAFIGGGGPPPTAPPTPTGLQATAVSSTSVSLAWNPSTGATGYTVYRNGSPLQTTTATTFVDNTVSPDTSYGYAVDAFNGNGNSPPTGTLGVTTPPTSGGGTAIIRAAGDIACDPADASFNNGNGTSSKCRQKYTAQLLSGADRVLPLGDTQYDCGGYQAFLQSYDQSWGAYKSISYPIVADEEHDTAGTGCGAPGADGYAAYFGSQAGPNGLFYYSWDFAGWHFIALNSECKDVPGGCAEGSPQNDWLEQDLAANSAACTIAYLHEPRFRSKNNGGQIGPDMLPFWQDLHPAGVEMILGGDSHFYERFRPQDPQGNYDPNGMVQWVVGTGGKSRGGLSGSRLPNSVTATASTFGVLELTLRSGSYDWRFIPEGSSSYQDSGTASCH